MTTMTGIPYAPADVTDAGIYYVTCPTCKIQIAGAGRTEDAQTKSAAKAYGAHYEDEHEWCSTPNCLHPRAPHNHPKDGS